MTFYLRIHVLLFVALALWASETTAQESQQATGSKKLRQDLDQLPFDFNTSLEVRYGHRTTSPPSYHPTGILGEARLQVDAAYYGAWSELRGKVDLGYDGILGNAFTDVREFNIDIYPQTWWSAKVGRQALTWGKGDLLFINDLFPKDFQSFFAGRDIQYLKAPSDAMKLTINPTWLQLNIIYTPQFDPDRYPTGERIVFFDQVFQTYRVEDNQLPVTVPDDFFQEDELAWRAQKNIKGFDLAFYGYYGYWKGPSGVQPAGKTFTFPSLQVHGMSIDGSILGGILAAEFGYYASTDDAEGSDPLLRNSEYRWLVNYSRDFKGSLTVGLQYYSELMAQYDAYVSSFPGGQILPNRQDMLTLRIRKLVNKQRLELSMFTFYGISNSDVYLRPRLAYKINDYWKIDLGANVFAGKNDLTFWNQFSSNSNIYAGVKWAL